MDHPALKLRGPCIGMQKTEITYEDAEYDYPYTPEDFPFFYDKAGWTKYLDMLADGAVQHALSVERASVYEPAEAAEVSGGAGASDGAAGRRTSRCSSG